MDGNPKRKKMVITSLFILLVMILELMQPLCMSMVYATIVEWTYEVLSDNTIKITGYNGEINEPLTIPSKIDDRTVKIIGTGAFEGKNNTVIFMNGTSIEKIEASAFIGNTLNSITFPPTLTTIENNAFQGCTNLSSITLPNSISSIATSTFEGCTSLNNVTIPESVDSIYQYAFKGCTSLTSITIPNNVTWIHDNAFEGCSSSMIVSCNSDSYAKDYCKKRNIKYDLKDIIVDTALQPINGIIEATVRSNVELASSSWESKGKVGSQYVLKRFYTGNATYNEEFQVIYDEKSPNNKVTDDKKIVNISVSNVNTNSLSVVNKEYIKDTETGKVTAVLTFNREVKEPEGWSFGANGVTISKEYNRNRTELVHVEDYIGGQYHELEISIEVTIDKLTSGDWEYNVLDDETVKIEKYLRNDPQTLEIPITIDGKLVTVIGSDSFKDNNIAGVNIPEGVKVIEQNAFKDCDNMVYANLPSTLTNIKSNVFEGCKKLIGITIPTNVSEIGSYAFKNCTSLKTVTMNTRDAGVECTIGAFAFSGCTGLTNITIPEGVTRILPNAFNGCTNMIQIWLPKTWKNTYSNTEPFHRVFANCDSLAKINVDSENEDFQTIDGVLYSKDKKILYKYPSKCVTHNQKVNISYSISEGTEKIGSYAFCSSLISSISIPNTVTEIEGNAFENCENLKELILPDSVNNLDMMALYGCTNLETVKLSSSMTRLNNIFDGCTKLTKLEIPNSITEVQNNTFKEEKCPNVVVYCGVNSNIKGYCKENNIKYEINDVNVRTTYEQKNGIVEVTVYSTNPPFLRSDWESIGWVENEYGLKKTFDRNGEYNVEFFNSYGDKKNIRLNIEGVSDEALRVEDIIYSDVESNVANSIVTLKFNREVKAPEGWALSEDRKSISKEITKGLGYTCYVEDYYGGSGHFLYPNYGASVTSGNWEYNILKDGTIELTKYTGNNSLETPLVIPSKLDEKTVKSIGTNVLNGKECYSIQMDNTEIEIINENAFSNAPLKQIILPETLKSIKNYAFSGCTALNNVTIPTKVSEIGHRAFSGCTALSAFTMNQRDEGIECTIKSYAFEGCTGLTNLTIPEGVTTIQVYAFVECTNLGEIVLPKTWKNTYQNVNGPYTLFDKCENLGVINVNSGNSDFQSDNGVLYSGDKKILLKYPVKCGTQYHTDVITYTVFNGTERIEEHAFEGAEITNIVIPNTVKDVMNNTFENCKNLKEVEIPNSVKYIDSNVFKGCSDSMVVLCNSDSYAKTYCIENNIKYELNDIRTICEQKNGIVEATIYSKKQLTAYGWETKEKIGDEYVLKRVFTNNGTYNVELQDDSSNKINITIKIEGVNTESLRLESNTQVKDSTTGKVTVTLSFNREVKTPNNSEGWTIGQDGKTLIKEYSENAKETVEVEDWIGGDYHRVYAEIDVNIETEELTADVEYSTKEVTNQDVVVSIVVPSSRSIYKINEGWQIFSRAPYLARKTFTENTTEEITIEDDRGIKLNVVVEVNNIDKTKPQVTIKQKNVTTDSISVEVEATDIGLGMPETPTYTYYIKKAEEDDDKYVKVAETSETTQEFSNLNQETKYTIQVITKDKAGNESISEKDITTEKILINIKNPNNTYKKEVIENERGENTNAISTEEEISVEKIKEDIETNLNYKIIDNEGKELSDNDKIGTNTTIEFEDGQKIAILVNADVDGDGEITDADLILVQQHLVAGSNNEWKLTDIYLKAADVNKDGKIDITDIVLIKRKIVNNI